MILGIIGVVFIINLFYLTNYAKISVISQYQLDSVLNVRDSVNITQSDCLAISMDIHTAQDILFVFMRIILPLLLMIICSVILIKHVRESRRRVIHGRYQKRENYFTVAVTFTNVAFFVFNLPITFYYIVYYYLFYSKVSLSLLGGFQFNLFFVVAYLFSYLFSMFTLCQFWIDLALNRLFRNEIFAVFILLFPRLFNRVAETQ